MELADQPYFSVRSSMKLDYRYERPDGSVAHTNYDAPKYKLDPSDVVVEMYHPNSSCTPSITGASQTEKIPEENGMWGRVDFFDDNAYLYNPDPPPLCEPPRYQEGTNPTAYVFCSEKDGKTVLICVSQVSDNPALAKQIFETFGWVE